MILLRIEDRHNIFWRIHFLVMVRGHGQTDIFSWVEVKHLCLCQDFRKPHLMFTSRFMLFSTFIDKLFVGGLAVGVLSNI